MLKKKELEYHADDLCEALIFSFNVGVTLDGYPKLLDIYDDVEARFDKMTNAKLKKIAKKYIKEGYISEEYFTKNLIHKDFKRLMIEIEMIISTFDMVDMYKFLK